MRIGFKITCLERLFYHFLKQNLMVTNTKFKMGSLIEIGGEIFYLFDPIEILCMVESI